VSKLVRTQCCLCLKGISIVIEFDIEQPSHSHSNPPKYTMPTKPPWIPPVLTCSAATEEGLERVLANLGDFETKVCTGKDKDRLRSKQNESWFWENLEEELKQVLFLDPALKDLINVKLKEVAQGNSHPSMATSVIISKLLSKA